MDERRRAGEDDGDDAFLGTLGSASPLKVGTAESVPRRLNRATNSLLSGRSVPRNSSIFNGPMTRFFGIRLAQEGRCLPERERSGSKGIGENSNLGPLSGCAKAKPAETLLSYGLEVHVINGRPLFLSLS